MFNFGKKKEEPKPKSGGLSNPHWTKDRPDEWPLRAFDKCCNKYPRCRCK